MTLPATFNDTAAAQFPGQGLNAPQDAQGRTALHLAAATNDVREVTRLLRIGCDIEQTDHAGQTALFDAVLNGAYDVIPLLTAAGADFSWRCSLGRTAFDAAIAQMQDVEKLAKLLDLGAIMDAGDGQRNAMHMAAIANHAAAIKFMAERGLNMDATDAAENTPLHLAVTYDSKDAAQMLLSCGCQPNLQDGSGDTPLYTAADEGNAEMTALLLSFPAVAEHADAFVSEYHFQTPLMAAAARGDAAVTRLLLDIGCNPNRTDSEGRNCAFIAAESGSPECLALLIAAGADAGKAKPLKKDRTPITHTIAKNKKRAENHGACLALLVDAGADIDAADAEGRTTLHVAAAKHKLNKIRDILKHNPDIDAMCNTGQRPIDLLLHTAGDDTSLGYETPRAQGALALLDAGADANISPHPFVDETPLYHAIVYDHADIIARLIEKKADPNVAKRGHDPLSPLQLCAMRGKFTACDLLAKAGADAGVVNKDGMNLLHLCAKHGNAKMAAWLLAGWRDSFDLNAADANGMTALHLACAHNQPDVAALLVAAGADTAVRDNDGWTPLHHAALSKGEDIVAKIHTAAGMKIDWNVTHPRTLETPLHLAAKGNRQRIIDQLCARGANLAARDKWGRMPLHNAVMEGVPAIVSFLIKKMNDSGHPPQDITVGQGWTFLHLAAGRPQYMLTALLAGYGFDINAANDAGDTPLHIAAKRGHTRTVDFLIRTKSADARVKNRGGQTPLDIARKCGHSETATAIENLLAGSAAPLPPSIPKPKLP